MIEGIIISKTNYLESSIICNIITKEGYKSIIYKGIKNKKQSGLSKSEILTKISFSYKKETNIITPSDIDLIDDYREIKEDLDKFVMSSVMIEYINKVREYGFQKEIYDLLEDSLYEIKISEDPELILFYYEVALMKYLGIALNKDYLISKYSLAEELIDDIRNIFNKKDVINRAKIRSFINEYYFNELDLKLKSKKIYFDIKEQK